MSYDCPSGSGLIVRYVRVFSFYMCMHVKRPVVRRYAGEFSACCCS